MGETNLPGATESQGEGELFAKSPLPTPRGLIYFLTPEKGERGLPGAEERWEDGAWQHRGTLGLFWKAPPLPPTQQEGGLVVRTSVLPRISG